MSFSRAIKRLILRSGIPYSESAALVLWLLRMGRWLKEHPSPLHLATRAELFARVAERVRDQPVDYLEFGVFRGESLRQWLELCPHPGARFFGFDTFTGLPDPWRVFAHTFAAGHFDAAGAPPSSRDPRARFIKGLFQETLPEFLRDYRAISPLVVHCDADLYDSTLYVLTALDPVMKPGTIVLFDDFSVATHDFRAFWDYTGAYRRKYEVIATAEQAFEKVAVKLL